MEEVTAPPASDAMQGVVPSDAPATAEPEEPEQISETLYIQNLNEKIKVDGEFVSSTIIHCMY
jgi:hypothetical protein